MSESIENYKTIAEKDYKQRGSLYSKDMNGDIFQVGEDPYNDTYVVDISRGYLVIFHKKTGKVINNREIISAIEAQMAEDNRIRLARGEVATILSDKDPILAEVLRMHLEYMEGKIGEPVKKEGIDFYSVGHNASHSFYVGAKEGKKYVLSILPEDCKLDENLEPIEDENGDFIMLEAEEDIREVTGDWGYIGHF